MLSRTQQHLYNVKTGVRPGCVTSALLFKLVIDWVMRKTTENSQRGFHSCLVSTLEDLNFAGDLVLLSHIHLHNQEKTNRLQADGQQVGLRISTKLCCVNTPVWIRMLENCRDRLLQITIIPYDMPLQSTQNFLARKNPQMKNY